MKLELMPQPITEPTSAWDVLKRVEVLITEEPKRLDMGAWWEPGRQGQEDAEPDPYKSSCGTRGCLAGWASWVIGHSAFNLHRVVEELGIVEYVDYTDPRPVAHELFEPGILTRTAHPVLVKQGAKYEGFDPGRVWGTAAHLNATVDHLHAWMAKNETYLKARMVQPHVKSELEIRWLKGDDRVKVGADGRSFDEVTEVQDPDTAIGGPEEELISEMGWTEEELISETDWTEECNCPVCRGISAEDIPEE